MDSSIFLNGFLSENDAGQVGGSHVQNESQLSKSKEDDAKRSQVKLIVTVFSNSRTSESIRSSAPESSEQMDHKDSSDLEPTITNLLTNLVCPCPLFLLSSRTLSPYVFQYTYATSSSLPDISVLRHDTFLSSFEKSKSLELVFDLIPSDSPQRPLKLAVFDMDSTLINEEVIDELARSIGITPAVSEITARAMNGEIEFAQSLRERLALLKGVKADIWVDLQESITIAEGARELCKALRKRGVKMAVVSGGFAPMAEWLKDQLGLDYAYANHVSVSPPTTIHPYDHLSGEASPDHPIITPEKKREILLSLSIKHSIPLSETLAVGDGSNDLLMLAEAGLGLAWRAKPKVQMKAPQRLNGESLTDVLFLLGKHGANAVADKEQAITAG